MRAPATKKARRTAAPTIAARLGGHVSLDLKPGGKITARFDGYALSLGTFSAEAAGRAQELREGLPLAAFAGRGKRDKEIDTLVRRLARYGLLEYRLGRRPKGDDLVVIEPQLPGYRPRAAPLRDADVVALSRFAYLRRRGTDMVLESPRADALFRICDPELAAALAVLATAQPVRHLRRRRGFFGIELLGLLLDSAILFKVRGKGGAGLRAEEGGEDLVLWDFHDLLFHARSTEGRHANPLGGAYPYAGVIAPLPGLRPSWPGRKIDLTELSPADAAGSSRFAQQLRERHSVRRFDAGRPITLAELAGFLGATARVVARSTIDLGDGGPPVEHAARPYPSAGADYPLELYLAVDNCEGLARGFYHYDAGAHGLTPIAARTEEIEAQLAGAMAAMAAPAAPQILITIAARFGRTSWKYASIAYALILKDVGVLLQSFYLMAADLGLGGCAIGIANIDLFAKMTGIEFHIEGPVGQFALGRGAEQDGVG